MTTLDLGQGSAVAVQGGRGHQNQASTGSWLHANKRGELATAGAEHKSHFPETDELFRGIYTRAATGFASEVVAVCSAIAGEGKTTVGVGIAITVAQDFPDRRVLLVETDLNQPVLAEDFGLEPGPGLVDCLLTGDPLLSVCRPTHLENLHILPAGIPVPTSGRPLRSRHMASLVDVMRQSYDLVILDLPPILTNSDAILLTDLVDGVICVVRGGVTPVAMIARAVEQIEDGKLRGVVLNGTASAVPGWLRRLVGV